MSPDTRDPDMVKLHRSELDFRIEVSERLSVIETRLASIDEKLGATGNVVSGINEDRSELKGAWKALAVIGGLAIILAGGLSWCWDHLVAIFSKGHS